jgi:hypothetical protein
VARGEGNSLGRFVCHPGAALTGKPGAPTALDL